jgi:exopolysaccharide biosynthesis polyprenyl glycosylphosphotransferase
MSKNMQNSILPTLHFVESLRLEKRRADRSKAHLSLLLFSFQIDSTTREEHIGEFISTLQRNTRETDIKGWVNNRVIGLVLPDTDEKGLKKCIDKIETSNRNLRYVLTSGTYPDHIFSRVLAENVNKPDLFPFDLDDAQRFRGLDLTLKRVIDILGSITGLTLFSPLMLATAVAIKVTSPGPAIFKQVRLGKKGIRFPVYKFRSMHVNTDDHVHREYVANLIKGNMESLNQGDPEKPLFKLKDDQRITSIGKIIRKLSIDELPQFWNVLRGEMSLVGPRPPLPYEVEKYEPWHLRRILEVKSGMTGLWQVDGRSKTSFDDMVRLDLKYALNWSLWLDIRILLKTVRAVVRPSGAL